MAKLAFLGLGVMGGPMAGHLQKAGHEVTVYNGTASKANDWVEKYTGQAAATPRLAAAGAEFVITCGGNDNDLRSVCLGDEGAFLGMANGAVFVDHTTVSAAVPLIFFKRQLLVRSVLLMLLYLAARLGRKMERFLLCVAVTKSPILAWSALCSLMLNFVAVSVIVVLVK